MTDATCEPANVLGMGHIGTGNDSTSSAYLADCQLAAERWNILGERAMNKHGLRLYTHNHSPADPARRTTPSRPRHGQCVLQQAADTCDVGLHLDLEEASHAGDPRLSPPPT